MRGENDAGGINGQNGPENRSNYRYKHQESGPCQAPDTRVEILGWIFGLLEDPAAATTIKVARLLLLHANANCLGYDTILFFLRLGLRQRELLSLQGLLPLLLLQLTLRLCSQKPRQWRPFGHTFMPIVVRDPQRIFTNQSGDLLHGIHANLFALSGDSDLEGLAHCGVIMKLICQVLQDMTL